MKITLRTRLAKADLALAQAILAKSSFVNLASYFSYIVNNLTKPVLDNPIQAANDLIAARPIKPLITNHVSQLELTVSVHEVDPKLLQNLQSSLSTNTYWNINQLFDYALCQLLVNPNDTFNFNFCQHDRLIIENVYSKQILQEMANTVKRNTG